MNAFARLRHDGPALVTRSLRRLALGVPRVRGLRDARDALLRERESLMERLARGEADPPRVERSPFYHYNASFDPLEVMRRHAAPDLRSSPGHLTNYLGVRMSPTYYPTVLAGREGEVEAAPIPANWHADIAEWGAVLRAVDLARETFAVIELGCGWGCWLNNAGAAARRAGRTVHLIGVEGDAAHLDFAREACALNGFAASQLTLRLGVAAPEAGFALFPRQQAAGVDWALEPVLGATAAEREAAVLSGRYDELPMVALDELAAPHDRIDLLHIDIQGGEADFIEGCLDVCTSKVAYIVIGTHSRQIEGRIMETLLTAGWNLEIERPAIFDVRPAGPEITVDGVQGWRNPNLLPSESAR